jgi:hypothetical protein
LVYPHGDHPSIRGKQLIKRGYVDIIPIYCDSIVDPVMGAALLLFDDCLIVAEQNEDGGPRLTVLMRLSLNDCTVNARIYCDNAFEISYCDSQREQDQDPPYSVLVDCSSEGGAKRLWLAALRTSFSHVASSEEKAQVGWIHRHIVGTLHAAAVSADCSRLQTALVRGADVNDVDAEGFSPLLLVCLAATTITSTSASPLAGATCTAALATSATDGHVVAATPAVIATASSSAYTAGMSSLLSSCVPTCVSDEEDWQSIDPIHSSRSVDAAVSVQVSATARFLESLLTAEGIDTRLQIPQGLTALHILSKEWRYDLVETLLRSGKVAVNERAGSSTDLTALHIAIDRLHTRTPQLSQASVRRDEGGDGLLQLAGPVSDANGENDCLLTVRVLLQYGASPNATAASWGAATSLERLVGLLPGRHMGEESWHGSTVDDVLGLVKELCLYGGRASAEVMKRVQQAATEEQLAGIRQVQKHWLNSNGPLRYIDLRQVQLYADDIIRTICCVH